MKRSARRLLDWKAVLGVLLGIALMVYAVRDVDPARVWEGIRAADPLLFLAGVAGATLMFAVRAARWRPLIEPVRADTAFRPRFAATTIGFMANNLLPARVGEFARAYSFARLETIPVAASIGSLVVERLLDGFTVIAFLLGALALPGFPDVAPIGGRDPGGAALGLLGVFIAIGVALFLSTLWPATALAAFDATLGRVLPRSFRRPVRDALAALVDGFTPLRRPALLARAVLWSLAVWLVGAVSFWLALLAFGIDVPFSGAVFLQSLIALAVALPAAPGFFGSYEAGARIGLVAVWGVPVDAAIGFAIAFHVATLVPVTVIGLYYVWRLGISWREVERSEAATELAVDSAERPRDADASGSPRSAAGDDAAGRGAADRPTPDADRAGRRRAGGERAE